MNSERNEILGALTKALNKLEESPTFSKIIPEVRSNIVFSIQDANKIEDVAGIDGRITEVGGFPRAAGSPKFGATDHMGRAILEVRKYEPSIRAGINLKFNECLKELVKEHANEKNIEIGEIDRSKEPEESKKGNVKSMPWKINYLYEEHGGIPRIFYESAGLGKEPLFVILGKNPIQVVEDSLEISHKI